MNITTLTERYFEKVKSDDKSTNLFKNLFKSGAYAVLKEIHRLNFPAFTLIDDNDLSKQGFVNMLLNKMVDEDDSCFVDKGLHFIEYKAYHEGEPSIKRVYENDDKNWLLVQLDNGRFDIAKNVWVDDKKESSVWKNQDGKVLKNVLNWRPIYPNGEV
jgi:hypothetical protein